MRPGMRGGLECKKIEPQGFGRRLLSARRWQTRRAIQGRRLCWLRSRACGRSSPINAAISACRGTWSIWSTGLMRPRRRGRRSFRLARRAIGVELRNR